VKGTKLGSLPFNIYQSPVVAGRPRAKDPSGDERRDDMFHQGNLVNEPEKWKVMKKKKGPGTRE